MKKLVLLFIVSLFLSACSTKLQEADLTIDGVDSSVAKETHVEFEIQKNALTYGFQSITPHVEVINKSESSLLIINPGLIQCSGIDIDRITSFNNEINIYVSKIVSSDSNDIVVPQLVVSLNGIDKKELENKKINIIGTNYQPISLKYNLNQVLNNIYAQYAISSNTTPHVKIKKEDDQYYWEIVLHNSFARDLVGTPLINFYGKVNSDTGEVLEANKELISKFIDEGTLLYSDKNGFIFYKQLVETSDDKYEIVWAYDGNEKKKIYTTHNTINSLQYNSKYNQISLIEYDGAITDLFLINLDDNTVQKITPMGFNHTWNFLWDRENLYFVNNDRANKSTFFKYNVIERKTEKLFSVNKTVSSFDFKGDKFIFNEFIEDQANTGVFITIDGHSIENIDLGFNIKFIDTNRIAYLKKDSDENKNTLWIYDLKDKGKISINEFDTRSYNIINGEALFVVGRNDYSPEFDSYIYSIGNMDKVKYSQTIDENLFYVNAESFYLNMTPPDKKNGLANIYKIDTAKAPMD